MKEKTLDCPNCSNPIIYDPSMGGRELLCPHCDAPFIAPGIPSQAARSAPQPSGPSGPVVIDTHRGSRNPYQTSRNPYQTASVGGYHRSQMQHRGVLILVLGILGVLVFYPLGIFAWVMGNNDLQKMRRGAMDREGYSLTMAGMILGIIASILCVIAILFSVLFFLMFLGIAASSV